MLFGKCSSWEESMVTRRSLIGGGVALAAAGGAGALAWPLYLQIFPPRSETGFVLSEAELGDALDFLDTHPAVDCHAHPGRTFVKGADDLAWKLKIYAGLGTFEDKAVAQMKEGRMGAAVFSAVGDFPLLDSRGGGLKSVRAFHPGEAYAYYKAQMANLEALAEKGLVTLVRKPAELETARSSGRPGAIFGVEGASFLDGDLGRGQEAFDDGVRIITLVHYLSGGQIGDIMTAPPVFDGLTTFGKQVVPALQQAGIIIDLAHCSEKTAFDALDLGGGPMVATHTHVASPALDVPRFISKDLALGIADSGGFVGAWPAGIGITTLSGYLDRIEELAELLGVTHVAIGSDMGANYKPVWNDYSRLPWIVGGLMQRGWNDSDLAAVIGGNFIRVFNAALAGRVA
ncbi:MAG TPA: hypothetical protein ENJ68_00890 [Devosia sp.]|nr:hypothetical protein [Devosia sp.]